MLFRENTAIDIYLRVNFQIFSGHKNETFRKSIRIGEIFSRATVKKILIARCCRRSFFSKNVSSSGNLQFSKDKTLEEPEKNSLQQSKKKKCPCKDQHTKTITEKKMFVERNAKFRN